jgi:hypothetical protein
MSQGFVPAGSSVTGDPFPPKPETPDVLAILKEVRQRLRHLPRSQAIRQLTQAVVQASPHKVHKDMNDENKTLWWLQ